MTDAARTAIDRLYVRHPRPHFTSHPDGKGGCELHSACGTLRATVHPDGLTVEIDLTGGHPGVKRVYLPDGGEVDAETLRRATGLPD